MLQPDGNLILCIRDLITGYAYPPYYASGTYNFSDTEKRGQKLIYRESGDLYILIKNGTIFYPIPYSYSSNNFYQRITLNSDGVLTWNYHLKTFASNHPNGWSTFHSIPDNICKATPSSKGDSGACGFNSICSIDENKRPICGCPQGYSLTDLSNPHGNCKPDFQIDFCRGNEDDEYKLVQLQNTDWNDDNYGNLSPCSEEECKSSCLKDCYCGAVVYSTDNNCYKKKLPLSYGVQDSGAGKTTWLKIGNGNLSNDQFNPVSPPIKVENKPNDVTKALLGSSVSINFILVSSIGLIFFFICNKRASKGYNDRSSKTIYEYSSVHSFTYKELENATNDFKEVLGRGAFGVVYKGKIQTRDSSSIVAVKKLERRFQNADKEFTAEVNVIGQTHHKNLVHLIGFCKEEDQRLLVYEYMSNGTLADYLFAILKPSWQSRVQIAQGIARGLLYLHEEGNTQIIHCDIKPQNILLDDFHNARISDFGLAKLLVLNQSQTNTAIRGTRGYVAPEWFKNKAVTVKVDVYSFGVLLLEIICCRRSISMEIIGEESAILTDWALDCYQSGSLDSLIGDDRDALSDRSRFETFLMVALWCIQEEPSLRPSMKEVTQMLEGVALVSNPPCSTSFSSTARPTSYFSAIA